MRVLVAGALIFLAARCDQSIDPIVGEDRPFTLWGFLDANADTQRVRVFSIEERLGTDRKGPIDAEVFSTRVGSGESIQWTDEEVLFPDSSVGHVFFAPFQAEFAETYQAVGSSFGRRNFDGRSDHSTEGSRRAGRCSRSNHCAGDYPRQAAELGRGECTIRCGHNPSGRIRGLPALPAVPGHPLAVTVPYGEPEEVTPNEIIYEVNLRTDFEIVQDTYTLNCLSPDHIGLRRIKFQFMAADEQWIPPGGAFDPNILVEPGTFSNVENGYGFFGGGYTVSEGWLPTLVVQRAVGFRTTAPCPMTPANIPECQIPPEPCFDHN